MRSDDTSNVMYTENFPRFSQSACAQRCFFSVKSMQGNNICKQIAFAEMRSTTSSDGSRLKKLLDDHVKAAVHTPPTISERNVILWRFILTPFLVCYCVFSDAIKCIR
ncbi:hypothetical protein AVEN_225300-1 [Araneus ventricosus]|uniref:Uncharacterized protein n=1 Tax=Araneus ventricosus TaxID=182803 RepID=A0A4Y2AN06_ARAVE|nr:hypothetical protein AVEN_225300-1 [Araneus ventricosus]